MKPRKQFHLVEENYNSPDPDDSPWRKVVGKVWATD